MSKISILLEKLQQLDEMGKDLQIARKFLKTKTFDQLAETILKLYYFNKIRKDEIDHWKKEILAHTSRIKEFNINKSGKPKNYTYGDLLDAIWVSHLFGEHDISVRLQKIANKGPDKLGRSYPLQKYKKKDEIVLNEFVNSLISYILKNENIDWSLLKI